MFQSETGTSARRADMNCHLEAKTFSGWLRANARRTTLLRRATQASQPLSTSSHPGGPRYDPSLTPEERRHANNAIRLCQTHGNLVDNDKLWFTEEELIRWKRAAESEARLRTGKTAAAVSRLSKEEVCISSRGVDSESRGQPEDT